MFSHETVCTIFYAFSLGHFVSTVTDRINRRRRTYKPYSKELEFCRNLGGVRLDSSSKDVTSPKQKLPFAVWRGTGRGRGQRACEASPGDFSSGTKCRTGWTGSTQKPPGFRTAPRQGKVLDGVESGRRFMGNAVNCLCLARHSPSSSSENRRSD